LSQNLERPVSTLPDPTHPSLTRRTVIKHAGLAAAAIAGLSACTNYGAPNTGVPSDAATSAGGGAGGQATGLTAKAADIPVGSGTIFPEAQAVITQPQAGEFKAFTSICTHQQCPVADVTDTINCKCHGSKFSITDGSVVNPPAPTPLAAKKVTVEGDTVTVA
jgi:nitrite reductase/ring-hydroxylating ferredoxin subunit